MSQKRFSSPREEALEIAYQTRRDILAGKVDAVAVLRACSAIASCLNKKLFLNWINKELSGYFSSDKIPEYRILSCPYAENGMNSDDFYKCEISRPIHLLVNYVKQNETIRFVYEDGDITAFVSPSQVSAVLGIVVDNCFQFLNETIAELQYGGIVEFLMEEIRKKTDEKLSTYNSKITEETNSLFLNLTSTNPADWNKVGHSCRKILKLFADSLFPSKDEKYQVKDGRFLDVGEPHFINRLLAFLDKNVMSDEKKFLTAQIQYTESYLRQVVDYAQMAEHNSSIEKFHADMLAIHTYLIISEILRYIPDK